MLVFISGTSGGGISNYFLNRILEKENEGGFLSWAISFLEVIIGTKWLWVIDLFIYKGFSLNFVLLVICYFGISTLFSILFVFKLFSSLFFIWILPTSEWTFLSCVCICGIKDLSITYFSLWTVPLSSGFTLRASSRSYLQTGENYYEFISGVDLFSKFLK